MSAADRRTKLGELQAKLVQALTEQGAAPAGFDAARLQAAAAALARKRARSAARAWPALARALGPAFEGRFAAFAARTPLPRAGGPLADGRAFARALAAAGSLPEEGRREALAVDLRYAACASGLRPRRGPAVVAAFLRASRRLVVAVRLPWLGERWFEVALAPLAAWRAPTGRPALSRKRLTPPGRANPAGGLS
jgi:hypothetical protein